MVKKFYASQAMPKKIITWLMLAGFTLASGSVMAKEYAIEVIVFDRPTDASSLKDTAEKVAEESAEESEHKEQWDFSAEHIAGQLQQMAKLAGKVSNHPTSDQLYSMETVRLNLLESGYRILDTTSWHQPSSFYQNAPVIPLGIAREQPLDDSIDDFMDVLLDDIPNDFSSELNDSVDDLANDSLDDLRIEQTPPTVTGFVRVYTTSLIHADLHLQLTPPMPDVAEASELSELSELSETEAEAQRYYFITEKRRLKFKQVHYFDHPMFGVILGIWQVDDSLGG